MNHSIQSIRPFIGAQNFEISRIFYRTLGFIETVISENLSFFHINSLGFYLQDYYVKDWVHNTMLFLEVEDVDQYWKELQDFDFSQFGKARLSPIKHYDWGKECFIHDPSGVLWHIGMFNKP